MRGRSVWDADRLQAALNVFGGAAFAFGSLLFFDSALQRLGMAFFVLGSLAMLFGAMAVWQQRYAVPRRELRRARAARAAARSLAPEPVLDYAGVLPLAPGAMTGYAADALSPDARSALAGEGLTSPAEPGSSPGSPRGD